MIVYKKRNKDRPSNNFPGMPQTDPFLQEGAVLVGLFAPLRQFGRDVASLENFLRLLANVSQFTCKVTAREVFPAHCKKNTGSVPIFLFFHSGKYTYKFCGTSTDFFQN